MENHRIKFGSEVIAYTVDYRDRKTLEISVYPDTSVRVVAPVDRSFQEIEEKVRKRASWIIEQRYFFSMFLPRQPEKRYVSGESFYYLGKQYRLKVIESDREDVILKHGFINIYIRSKNKNHIEKLLNKWYRQKAEIKFKQRLNLCSKKINKYGIADPSIQIRKMTKRWGSCSKNNSIILNTELIKAPSHCIDYVILHEMCHLKYFNHSRKFYDLLVKMMPDWEKRKKRLESVII